MDEKKIIGHKVNHKILGAGTILGFNAGDVQVEFEGDDICDFNYPDAFVGFLQIDDAELQEEILNQCKKGRKIKEKHKPEINTAHEHKKTVLEWGDSYSTHAEALNDCFGFDYKHYQKAYKVLNGGRFAVWFPNIARQIAGEYVSTDNTSGWVNILSEAGKVLIQMDNGQVQDFDKDHSPERFVFAKFDGERGYRFIGLFDRGERVDGGVKFSLISRKIDLKKMESID